MIVLRASIEPALAQRLDEHFCEWLRSPWCLLQENPGDPYQLSGYFESDEQAREAWEELRGAFPELTERPTREDLADADWQNAYKAFLTPWQERDLHWVPTWMRARYTVPSGHTALYLDAGMAFGTGSHETTRLCMRRLLDYRDAHAGNLADTRLIDAGCGSGILAISARLLGFGAVEGFDRDPEAVTVSRANLAENGLPADAVAFAQADLEGGLAGRQADVLVANIQADVLGLHAGALLAAVRPGGWLILSGILAGEVDATASLFCEQAAAIWTSQPDAPHIESEGDWAVVLLKRPGAV